MKVGSMGESDAEDWEKRVGSRTEMSGWHHDLMDMEFE